FVVLGNDAFLEELLVEHGVAAADEVFALDVEVAPARVAAAVGRRQLEFGELFACRRIELDAACADYGVDAVGRANIVAAAGVSAGLVQQVVVKEADARQLGFP